MLDIFEITFFGLSNSNVANTVNNESRTVIAGYSEKIFHITAGVCFGQLHR